MHNNKKFCKKIFYNFFKEIPTHEFKNEKKKVTNNEISNIMIKHDVN